MKQNIIIASRFEKDIAEWKRVLASSKKLTSLAKRIVFSIGTFGHLKNSVDPKSIRVIIGGVFLGDSHMLSFEQQYYEFTSYIVSPTPILFTSMTEPSYTHKYGVSGMSVVAKNDENMLALCELLCEFDLEKVDRLRLFKEKLHELYPEVYVSH